MARIGREEEPITVVPDDPETVPTAPDVQPEREPAPATP